MKIKPWHFVVLGIFFFGVFILGMRHNNITAYNKLAYIEHRDADGYVVDEELEELQEYVFNRMNTSMRFSLNGAYERDKIQAQVEADAVDSGIYEEAQEQCDREGQQARENAECVQRYVEQRLSGQDQQVNLPDIRNYSYTLHAPIWAPDVPGIAILLTILSFVVALYLYIKSLFKKKITT